MELPIGSTAQAAFGGIEDRRPPSLPIPHYLEQMYWWAYVHPRAVRFFDRGWMVNTILFGNYGRLREAAVAELGERIDGRTLQVACVYGNLSQRIREHLSINARLDIVDILPIQLKNLAKKMPPDDRVALMQIDSTALGCPDASYDQVLVFFLLHEQPEAIRRATLAEAFRVVKPGGKVVIVDYHRPRWWHPLRPLQSLVFRKLEPFAMDLWTNGIRAYLPPSVDRNSAHQTTYFGGLYQKLVFTR